MNKIKYTCKNCSWETSIWEEWEDLKPSRCMNKKCNTSFRVNPELLEITRPEKTQELQKDEKKNGQTKNTKRKEISNAE
jgi:hypothetical protein